MCSLFPSPSFFYHDRCSVLIYLQGRTSSRHIISHIDKSVNEIDDKAYDNPQTAVDIDIRTIRQILDSYLLFMHLLSRLDRGGLHNLVVLFEGCEELTHITLPSVKQIDGCAFENTDLKLKDLELSNRLFVVSSCLPNTSINLITT